MKKILLSCFILAGLSANAQQETILTENFEAATNGTRGGWESGYFGTATTIPAARNDFFVRSNADCAAYSPNAAGQHLQIVRTTSATAIGSCLYGAQTNGTYSPLIYKQVDANLYRDMLLSFKWLCGGQALIDYGTVVYSLDGSTWSSVSTTQYQGSTTVQSVTDLALPADLNFKTFFIGFRWFANGTTHNVPGFSVDDIVIKGSKPTAIPECSAITAPTSGSTVNAGAYTFTWSASANANSYKITVGTTPGASDVYNATVAGLSTSVPLAVNSTYYAKVTPTNTVGDATGCSEITFTTTGAIVYCTAGISGTADELITNVKFANIANPSTGSAGYEDFTSIVGNVKKEESYLMTVSVAPAYTGDQVVVWIDENGDGDFSVSEKTILTLALGSATGNITISPTAVTGSTRMRIRLHYNNPAIVVTACGTTTYGQVEDYTVNIAEPILAASETSKSAYSVYPNPFTDVLKISDVKGVKSISISDVSGRLVKTVKATAEIQVSELKTGLYIVNLHMEDGSVKSIKAIKK